MNSSVKFGTTTINYNVIYSKRKTIEIGIKAPDIVTVRAPKYISIDQIDKTVLAKGKWIVQKLSLIQKVGYIPIKREYLSGEEFMYMGRSYSLEVINDESNVKPEIKLNEGKLIISISHRNSEDMKEIIKNALEEWYRQKAKEMIENRVEYYNRHFKLKPKNIKIKDQKTRWGSCTFKNDLAFNYKLIMAPSDVLDYVVVHEMCHMEHKDHSKAYWRRVSSILPDYKDRKQWLREHGVKMDI